MPLPGDRPLSVVIPAHNEAAGISRLLEALVATADPAMEFLVVCNGCTDGTADVAAGYGPPVRVLQIPDASKQLALQAGDAAALYAYRAWVDADVVVGGADLRRLIDALSDTVLATAPARRLELAGASRVVRWYYDVWQQLPQVRAGVFGRGVVVMSPRGHARVRALPAVMSDDLAASEAFAPGERAVVDSAVVTVRGPRTLGDLVRRRVRVATGNAQLDALGLRSVSARTSVRDLLAIARSRPAMVSKLVVFLMVTLWARTAARQRVARGDFSTWLRDESSRRPGGS